MDTPKIKISEEEAKELYKDYSLAIKEREDKAEKYLKELKQVYYHLSKGHQLLDIFEVFKNSGVNEQGEPKLAICRADAGKCVFKKQNLGAGYFSDAINWNDRKIQPRFDVDLPTGTFPNWKEDKTKKEWDNERIIRHSIQTKLPICPAHLLPNGKLDNYYYLWEVSEWNEVPIVADPFLLKRINSNAFIILAEWDLTEVEQSIIRGM